jgi:hypothetical protein
MFQPTQRRISEKIKSTLDSDALPFHEILDADMVESAMTAECFQTPTVEVARHPPWLPDTHRLARGNLWSASADALADCSDQRVYGV